MYMYDSKIMLIAVLISILSTCSRNVVIYELTPQKVDRVMILDNEDGYCEVVIILNKLHREEFGKLTENNIGARLKILLLGKVLISPTIKAKIESGYIQGGRWRNKKDALRIQSQLSHK